MRHACQKIRFRLIGFLSLVHSIFRQSLCLFQFLHGCHQFVVVWAFYRKHNHQKPQNNRKLCQQHIWKQSCLKHWSRYADQHIHTQRDSARQGYLSIPFKKQNKGSHYIEKGNDVTYIIKISMLITCHWIKIK